MNATVELILSHRSIRQFRAEPISPLQLQAIFAAAQAAPSSSFLQPSSIICISDLAVRDQLARLAGEQGYVREAAEFLVFCADFYRHKQIVSEAQTGFAEQLLIGVIDTSLMAQNAMLAAQSMGLGGVYIGGIRNCPEQVSALLGLPEHVIPLFGLCLGHAAQTPEQKPRLPQSLVVHQERYNQKLDKALLAQYDQQISDYYQKRSSNVKTQSWSGQIKSILSKESRPFMLAFLHSQGFNLK